MRRQEFDSEGKTHEKQKERDRRTGNTDPQTKFDTGRRPRQGNDTILMVKINCREEQKRNEGRNEGKERRKSGRREPGGRGRSGGILPICSRSNGMYG